MHSNLRVLAVVYTAGYAVCRRVRSQVSHRQNRAALANAQQSRRTSTGRSLLVTIKSPRWPPSMGPLPRHRWGYCHLHKKNYRSMQQAYPFSIPAPNLKIDYSSELSHHHELLYLLHLSLHGRLSNSRVHKRIALTK